MPAIVNAVLFDFDHTLGIDNKLEEEVLRDLAAVYCAAPPSTADIGAVLARFRYEPVTLDEAIAAGLVSWGCPQDEAAAGVAAFRARCLALAPKRVEPLPGAGVMLRALHGRGLPVGILSNGWTQLQHLKARLIGFPGPVLSSEEIGAWKPDVKAFDIALSRFSMIVSSTMYVGDNPEVDIAGAKAAGLLAAWVDWESEPYPAGLAPPDLTVTRLDQLPELLK
jgi:FMN phosphatase YigB (HAD superfamily)